MNKLVSEWSAWLQLCPWQLLSWHGGGGGRRWHLSKVCSSLFLVQWIDLWFLHHLLERGRFCHNVQTMLRIGANISHLQLFRFTNSKMFRSSWLRMLVTQFLRISMLGSQASSGNHTPSHVFLLHVTCSSWREATLNHDFLSYLFH